MTEFVLAPKQALAIIVMIAIIMVCVLAPFGAAHAIVGVSTAAVTILVAALAAIGITFTTTGVFDNIEDYVESLLQEYADDNNIPVTSIFQGSQWAANAAGKLILNNRFVRLISSFATWIQAKYNLSDNSVTTIVQGGNFLNGLPAYALPLGYVVGKLSYEYTHFYMEGGYVVFYYNSQSPNTYFWNFLSDTPNTVYWWRYNSDSNTTTNYSAELTYDSTLKCYKYRISTSKDAAPQGVDAVTYSEFTSAFGTDEWEDVYITGIGINTGSIDIPTDRNGYTDADGAILDVSAPWSEPVSGVINTVPSTWDQVMDDTTVYTLDLEAEAVLEEGLPQPSDIENLPGATIPGIPDIDGEPWHLEFSNLWHYVAQWISDVSAGGAVIWNTCIQAPPPVVNLVFAGIVLAMWFGAIKILR